MEVLECFLLLVCVLHMRVVTGLPVGEGHGPPAAGGLGVEGNTEEETAAELIYEANKGRQQIQYL